MPPAKIEQLKKLPITVYIYKDIGEDQEEHIFQTVQGGRPLVFAEILGGVRSQWTDYVNYTLLKKLVQTKGGQTYSGPYFNICRESRLRNQRNSYFLAYARICWTLDQINTEGMIPNIPGPKHFMEWAKLSISPVPHPSGDTPQSSSTISQSSTPGLGEEDTPTTPLSILSPNSPFRMKMQQTQLRLTDILERQSLNNIAFCPNSELPSLQRTGKTKVSNTVSPAEFVMIWIFTFRHEHHLKPKELAYHIRRIRDLVESRFPGEKKFNMKVMMTFWEYEQGRDLVGQLREAGKDKEKRMRK
ncbi:hypothetical protein DL93DRAFT_226275 [Clavulina sp. PMI_390]|nr:hypothetical protein DL93DRAFT_226275 [Clavulina sp. PMI_390]